MKKAFLAALAVACLLLAGCGNKSERGGDVAGKRTFTLSGPTSATEVKRGESRVIRVSLNRDKEFTENVLLAAEPPRGTGLTCEVLDQVVKGDQAHADLKVSADKGTQLGKHNVRVIATPAKGNAVDLQVVVDVKESPAQEKGR